VKKNIKIDYEVKDKIKIIGIVSTEKDYKLSWLINNLLNLHLKRGNVDIIPSLKDKLIPVFYFDQDDISYLKYILIKNKYEDVILFPHLKSFDYFLVISGIFDEDYIFSIYNKLKNLEFIIAAYILQKENFKNIKKIVELLNLF